MEKRFLAMLLAVCMVLSITPTAAFAESFPQAGKGNLCTHHIHDEKCGYAPSVAQADCDKDCKDTNGDGVIDHTADCAYSPATAASPCTFNGASCAICHPKNGKTGGSGTALPTPGPALPTPDPALPTPGPALPTPDPALPTPDPALPTPDPALPTPGPALPTPGPALPTPDPALPTPDPALPTPDPALPTPDPALAKTDAPTTAMATVAKETDTQPSVSFVLDNQTAYTDTATWAVYDGETATTALLDIVASCNANTLTLAHPTDLPVAVYYVAVTESGKAESARLALTVAENVAPAALLGATATFMGSGGTGARSSKINEDVFLGGNFIEVGISEIGSLGTSSNAPTKARPVNSIFYHPTHIKIGLRSIGGGWGTGAKDTTRDFFLPGTIDEGFMTFWGTQPIYQAGGCHIGNNIAKDKNITSTGTIDQSTPSLLKATTAGTMNNVLDYVQVITFKADEKQFKTVVTLTNNSAAPLDNLYYIRRFDPDQGLNGNNTDNYFLNDEAGGTWCVASTAPLDGTSSLLRPLDRHTAFSKCENVFCFYTDDLRAEPITGELAFITLGGNYAGNAALDGKHFYDDKAIGLRFDIGTLAPGASTELTYYTGLDPDVEGAVNKAEDVIINITQQPIARTFVEGSIEGRLRTRGEVLIAGASAALSYQWYQNTSASNAGGTPILGATGYDFEISTSLTATSSYYYYCVVSADGKSVPSQPATICVVPAGTSIYTVKFDSNSTGTITGMQPKQTVANGRSLIAVRDPSCTNSAQSYFNGWYKTAAAANTDLWNFADPITADMTLYAGWTEPPTLNITNTSLSEAREGFAYTQPVAAEYTGKKVLVYGAVGLPSGLSIDSATGIISGNPPLGTSRSAPYAVEITVEEINSINPISIKKTLDLLVGTPPIITTQPTNQESVAGTAAHFAITATGVPDPTYQWEKWNGASKLWEKIDGATGSTYTIAATTFEMNGDKIRCKVENVITGITNTLLSDEAVLTVTSVPVILTNLTDQTVAVPAGASFKVKAQGSKPLQYQWEKWNDESKVWETINGETGDTYTIGATTFEMNGDKVRCRLENVINGITNTTLSAEAVLTVTSAPFILTNPTDQTVAVPAGASFKVKAQGSEPLQYQWEKWNDESKLWEKIDGATGETYTIDPTTFAMNGAKIRCRLENVINGITNTTLSAEAVLTVTSAPFILTNPTDQAVVAPTSASFTVEAQGSKPLQYQWEFSADNGATWSKVTSGTGINSETYVTAATEYDMNGYLYRCQVSGSVTPPAISQPVKLKVDKMSVFEQPGSNEFWIGIVAKIQAAQKGDVLKINTGVYIKMPACVMEELRIKGAGMAIKWYGGKDIVIPAGKAHNAEENRDFWTLAELSELYKNYSFAKVKNETDPKTDAETDPKTDAETYPKTDAETYSYVDNKTSETTPVTGNIVDTTTTQGSQIGKYILVIVAGTLIAVFSVLGVCIWARKKENEDNEDNEG